MLGSIGDRRWLIRSVLALYIISSIFAAYMLYQINGVVHGTMYNYGLEFDNGWAVPYWSLERLLYVYLLVPSIASGFLLAFDLWTSRVENVPVVRRVENNFGTGKVSPVVQTAARDNSMMINCPKCSRLFSRPMSMLDFSSGKAQLVNVCPYCNQVLGDTERSDVELRVVEPEKDEVSKRR